jgi:peptidoglycan/xylan/chitin deacetylase (PgdA/CDA1 family)
MMPALLACVGGAALAGWSYGTFHQNATLFGPVLGTGPRDERRVYLTFDDGPNPTATERVLDVLARTGTPAAFFLVGRHVRRFPQIARSVAEAGHAIGNHTERHVRLHLKGPRFVERELATAHEAILDATGRAPRMFRAPHGYHTPFVHRTARRLGYDVVGWSAGVWDSARPGVEVIRARVRRALRPGAILLLHDGDGYDAEGDRTQTARALPSILRDAREAGYSFGSLSDLVTS